MMHKTFRSSLLKRGRKVVGPVIAASIVLQMLAPVLAIPAQAASVGSAAFTGDNKTLTVNDTLYAKKNAALSLTVNTSGAKCVVVSGAHNATQTHNSRNTWTFGFTAGDSNGVKMVTATAYDDTGCKNNPASVNASYTLDNAGPVATATLLPAASDAGWNNSLPVVITWEAEDAGVGFAKDCDGSDKTLNPCTENVTTATSGTSKTTSATDRLGNTASPAGSVTVRVDTTVPTITGSRSPAAPSSGWNNTNVTASFICDDPKQGATKDNLGFASGIKSCGPNQTVGTEGANQTVTGSAVDAADNQASATIGNINIDKTPPTVTGAPTTAPNGAGWYRGDVAIAWACSDALSGLASTCPADSTVTGEGNNLGATSASISDKAGNSGAGSVSGIQIDRTAPNTTATAPSNWNNVDVTVVLEPNDALSGVKATYYQLDGGAVQPGTSVTINTDGLHTIVYQSEDLAGNVEATKSVQVKIDKTKPTINHALDPEANGNGWNNSDVTVTFTCDDAGGSGLANCTLPQLVTSEGQNQQVSGTATDNAGNTVTDPATVSIDKTAPVINPSLSGALNGNGWYKDDVTVSYACTDVLSGITGCPAAQKLGEGADQSATGTATDAAGNSQSAGISGINVDKTAPSLAGTPTTNTNGSGWYNGDVVIHWAAADVLSGIDPAAMPSESTITGEGNNLSASASVSDRAGNQANATVSGINIDRTAPSTSATIPPVLASGWYAGAVEVTLTGIDSLSGVGKTFYSIDGGEAQLYSDSFSHNLKGEHTITFWSVDQAGNVEDKLAAANTITLKIDDVAPTTSSDAPSGWQTASVTVNFTVQDQAGLSGVAYTQYSLDGGAKWTTGTSVILSSDGMHSLLFRSVDVADNTEQAKSASVSIDMAAPVISGADVNDATWRNTPLSESFTAEDAVSGLADSADASFTLTAATQSAGADTPTTVSKTVADKAGHVSTRTLSALIDLTAPSTPTFSGIAAQTYTQAALPAASAISCSATDALSDLASNCTVEGYSNLVGKHTLTATARDRAGNVSTSTLIYTVANAAWTLQGFHQPIGVANSISKGPGEATPSPSTTTIWNAAKGGSTIPLKFNVFQDGVEKTATTDIKSFNATKLASCTSSLNDAVEELANAGASSLRYDGVSGQGGQFVQNWKTSTVSGDTCYRVALTTQDNSTLYTFVKLRK